MNRLREKISVTELSAFRDCRRAWYLSRIEGLEPKVPQMNFWFGRAVHKLMEFYNRGLMIDNITDPEPALALFARWFAEEEVKLEKAYGPMTWPAAQEGFMQVYVLITEMFHNYREFLEEEGDFDRPLMVEEKRRVPILDDQGNTLPGEPVLVGVYDRVSIGLELVDYKTSSRKVRTTEALDIDEQFTGYAYLFYRDTGVVVSSLNYESFVKAKPEPPEPLKSGGLSKKKQQRTTYKLYLQALEERKLNPNGYLEVLSALKEKGWSDYFTREVTYRNIHQLMSFEQRLHLIYREMLQAAEDPRLAYPNPSPMRCPQCPFLSVCHNMEDGSDYESLIEAHFNRRSREDVIERKQ